MFVFLSRDGIMLLNNDSCGDWVNGTIAVITDIYYSEDINEIAAMAGSFSTEEGANAEAIMGGILATPPEKPNRPDLTGHLNWLYDRVVMPLESVKGAKVEGSSEEEIPDLDELDL